MATQISIKIDGLPGQIVTIHRELNQVDRRRLLQSLCAHLRTLQLWLEEEERNDAHPEEHP
ncbi:MAG: hypothetical protein M1438_09280 [Deltaproteobacteria bacterium]|nr:hypothetical protein [Deltaproteobacteria bacterium]